MDILLSIRREFKFSYGKGWSTDGFWGIYVSIGWLFIAVSNMRFLVKAVEARENDESRNG